MAELALNKPVLERPALSAEIMQRIQPVTLSGQKVLPVPEAVRSLFPWGGVQRGTSVSVAGNGGWALAMAVMAEALGAEGWLAVVGVPDLGLAAAAEFGVRLDRVLVVETPSVSQWPVVVASLLEAVDVVAIAPEGRVGPRDARRLNARAREQESVLLHLDGARTWPTAVDLNLAVSADGWEGLGDGHGYLQARLVTIEATGRRSAARASSLSVWLPGPMGGIAAVGRSTDAVNTSSVLARA